MAKTYAEYLRDSKPITNHLAPPNARPKMTKGDSYRYRRRVETMKRKGEIFQYQVPVRKDGIISITKLKDMKRV